jgi:hypothetical protein
MTSRIRRLVTLVALLGLLATVPGAVAVSAQEATPTSAAASPRYEPPAALPEGGLSDEELRAALIASRRPLAPTWVSSPASWSAPACCRRCRR